MPRRCVFGCEITGITVHRFPNRKKNPELFKKWVFVCGGKLETEADYDIYSNKTVCDKHFSNRDRNRNNRLNALAIPSPHVIHDTQEESSSETGHLNSPLTSLQLCAPEESEVALTATSEPIYFSASTTVIDLNVKSRVQREHNYTAASKFRRSFTKISYCVTFLKKQAAELDLSVKIYELVPEKPIVVLTWLGKEPSLPSILLNSHMDVVPVFENSWTHPPFSGYIDQDGKIFARGSQDMKCVGIQYLEAIRKLKAAGVHLKRTLHVSFVPDEEIGGHDGMEKFVHTQDFKALNVGFALDEGMASPTDEFVLFNGERSIWQIHVHCTGQPGHGSLLIPNTAGEKLRYIIDKFMDLRVEQKNILDSNPQLSIGDVTSVNLTQIYGGVQSNVIPEKLTVVFDIRLAVTVDHTRFESTIKQWCKEAGEGVTFEFEQKNPNIECTRVDATNPFWVAFKSAADKLDLKLNIRIFPGGTDSRYVRHVGIPALGFSPINNTPILLHDHDEYLPADVFVRGIDIYETLIPAVANV